MFYAIDFDSRKVESKSEDEDLLTAYILDNDLSQAVALIDSADELCLQFSLNEMAVLYGNIGSDGKMPNDEEDAADAIWDLLEESKDDFPTFTPALGKKLIKSAGKEAKPSKVSKPKGDKVSTPRIKLNRENPICVIEGKCKRGSILHTIVSAIEDELCSSVGEVLNYITSNHVIHKTGELADVKFAEHNIKYFVKRGNIAMEEGL